MLYPVVLETADDLCTYLFFSGTLLQAVKIVNCNLNILHMYFPTEGLLLVCLPEMNRNCLGRGGFHLCSPAGL